jgi:hypothetical protein
VQGFRYQGGDIVGAQILAAAFRVAQQADDGSQGAANLLSSEDRGGRGVHGMQAA